MSELLQGWMIDRDYGDDPDRRVGVGQTDLDVIGDDFTGWRPVTTIETDLKASDFDTDRIRFRIAYSDPEDGVECGGFITRKFFEADEDSQGREVDPGYHIDNFAVADYGAEVQFRGRDLPEAMLIRHREINCVVKGGGEEWVVLYG